MSNDLDEDELFRRLSELWVTHAPPKTILEDEDRAVAAKLLGKSNYERMTRAKRGQRVKYLAPVVTAEFHCFPSASQARTEHWMITMIEDGRRRPLNVWLTQEQCMLAVRWLQEEKGITARSAETEYMKYGRVFPSEPAAKPQRERSKRFDPDWLRRATQS